MSQSHKQAPASALGGKEGGTPVDVFLFAAHHASGNIAAQRFKALTGYLDPDMFHIHIFTRKPNDWPQNPPVSEFPNITVHLLEGECVGSAASPLVILTAFVSAFAAGYPFLLGRLGGGGRSSWLVNALALSASIYRSGRSSGRNVFVIGTYSPIDALIASRCLAAEFGLPNMQDFRDGFVFESLGRKGKLASLLRSLLERRVAGSATLITSVSAPIVDDFRRRYDNRVELLPNGFDPAEFAAPGGVEVTPETRAILEEVPDGKAVIGHFGRLSDSDHARLETFRYFIQTLKEHRECLAKVHLLFVGKLTPAEIDLLEDPELACSKTIRSTVPRPIAQELMKHCDVLLLITGDTVGCATGKVFEYMASKREIACFTQVMNEAAKIIETTRTGRTVTVGDSIAARSFFDDVADAQYEMDPGQADISRYDRRSQADLLSRWIQSCCFEHTSNRPTGVR